MVLEKNLLSVSRLFEQGYSPNFNNDVEVYLNNDLITTTCSINNLYYLKLIFLTICDTKSNNDLHRESKRLKINSTDLTYL